MSDIDFDELDKAVNTLMSDVPKVEPPKTEDIKTLTISSTIHDDSRPSLAKLDATLTEVHSTATPTDKPASSTPARASAPSLATRRGGRFMDVVHPSSDMKQATKSTPSSRQGVTIEPTGKPLSDDTDDADDQSDGKKADEGIAPETYKDLTVSDVSAEPKNDVSAPVERDIPTNDWPDPLEMSGYDGGSDTKSDDAKDEKLAKDTSTDNKADVAVSAFADNKFDMEDTQPLTSPFIPDAKVEKRPLGGVPADTPVEEPSRAPVLGALVNEELAGDHHPAEQLPVTPADVEVQLPPELQSDLMAIETDGDTDASDVKSPDQSTPAVDKKTDDDKTADKPAAILDAKPVAAAVTSTGATSIPQQYHEAPSTSDEQSGSIYDTDSYHQPIAHPAKTKSGWLWIIWILLLLIVGGGGAVALYFIGVI